MKLSICSSLVILTILTGSSFAQIRTEGTRVETDSATGVTRKVTYTELKEEEVITPRHDMLTINPLKFFLFWNLSYYHAFNGTLAGGIGFQIPSLSAIGGFGANAEVRIYPSHKSLRGFYVAPNVSWNHLTDNFAYDYSASGSSASIDVISAGLLVGWQWFIGDDFAIGLGLGVDHYFVTGSNSYSSFGSYTGTLPALRFDIGYGW